MSELHLVALANWHFEFFEQSQAGLGDADLNDAAVVGHPLADDKASFGKSIQNTRDVRVVRNEPRSEGQRGQGRGMLGLEQTQGVVLLRGQVVLRKELVLEHAEAVVRPP